MLPFKNKTKKKTLVAIEMGTSKMVLGMAETRSDGILTLTGLWAQRSAGVRKGEIVGASQAGQQLKRLILEAEKEAGRHITDGAYLLLSGSHLRCDKRTHRLEISPEEDAHVTAKDTETLAAEATEKAQSEWADDRWHVATIPRSFRIDGGSRVSDPVGMNATKLEGDFLVVHGIASHLKNLVSKVKELKIDIETFSLSPIASAHAVLGEEQRDQGTLVIDMGGGLTHYAVYQHGNVDGMGVIGVGGDHVTQDISRAFNLPVSHSDKLKREHGIACLDRTQRNQIINLKSEITFGGAAIYVESLMQVVRARWEETFEIIKGEVGGETLKLLGGGVVLTGGSARTPGIERLANEVFGLPVQAVGREARGAVRSILNAEKEIDQPEYSTVLGGLMLAHEQEMKKGAALKPLVFLKGILEKVRVLY